MPKGKSIKRIEICGGIASGKTTLAHLLADGTDYGLVLENFRANPFWSRFYQKPELFMVEKNICFLAQHTGEIKSHISQELLVCDYAVFQDVAYASLCKENGHLDVMRKLFDYLYTPLQAPTLVVYLVCGSSVQLERIRARARAEEQAITLEYLDSLNQTISDFLRQSLPAHTKILEICSDQVDFVHNKDSCSTIRENILSLAGEDPSTLGR